MLQAAGRLLQGGVSKPAGAGWRSAGQLALDEIYKHGEMLVRLRWHCAGGGTVLAANRRPRSRRPPAAALARSLCSCPHCFGAPSRGRQPVLCEGRRPPATPEPDTGQVAASGGGGRRCRHAALLMPLLPLTPLLRSLCAACGRQPTGAVCPGLSRQRGSSERAAGHPLDVPGAAAAGRRDCSGAAGPGGAGARGLQGGCSPRRRHQEASRCSIHWSSVCLALSCLPCRGRTAWRSGPPTAPSGRRCSMRLPGWVNSGA